MVIELIRSSCSLTACHSALEVTIISVYQIAAIKEGEN
jgi:hypothetical protein